MTKHLFPQGALELVILRILNAGPEHGWGIAQKIHLVSKDVLKVEEGSLYPALSRMVQKGWIKSEWGTSENNRRAKFYELTDLGQKRLSEEQQNWNAMTAAIAAILEMENN
ncbi:MAG: PadR family transcriptional regulator [Opitutales bacterium]|nr:PadR family transcriptional regulator [Opitutales bacterium]